MRPDARVMRALRVLGPVLVGLVALAVYALPWLAAPAAHWPLWDVRVYWWGGRQAAAGGGALYAAGAPFSFTYPPFAALLFSAGASAQAGAMKIALTAGSLVALTVLCGQALAAAGIRRRPEVVFAVSALALQNLGAPARVPDDRVRLLRRHRPARFADLLDAPLGLGRPAPGVAERGGLAAPVRGLGAGGGRRRGGLLRLQPLPWPGHPADPVRMVASDLYVLFGLAVLGAVGVALARGRSPDPTGGP